MFYSKLNQERFTATSNVALAKELYRTSFCRVSSTDIYDWCDKCAQRIYVQYDIELDYKYRDLDGFVKELIKNNLIGRLN
ncbi:MAG: hypothetical protein Tp1123DCM1511741_36 [Prokaryotic dsDNA virus sp.]|nr:MAG: hypothetical protein Tp1123DCM1511741_36 [Prokaryotic dsDNA virus sp.]